MKNTINDNKDLKTTDQWCKKLNINIIDYDGWDRKNLENALNEYITLDEFNLRISKSTIAISILTEKFVNPDLVLEEKIGYFDTEEAVAQLLKEGTLFLNTRDYKGTMPVVDEAGGRTMVIFMNCNDTFGPYADADDITLEEVEALYKEMVKYPKSGSTRWICFKRNMKPWSRKVARMKENGEWDAKMEELPDNKM